jgi:hypothetical protein
MYWIGCRDGDPRAFAIMARHYSFKPYKDGRRQNQRNPNRRLFCGPGQKMVLIGVDLDALFVWRKFLDDSGQTGINCAVFRNESRRVSSELILEAEHLASSRWPGERMYTYVDPMRVRSRNPGYCFKCAGWGLAGATKSGKLILEKWMPG